MSQIGNRDNENYRTQDFPDGGASLKGGTTYYYRPQTKLRRLCFYTCLSVHRGSLPQCMLGYHTPRTRYSPGPGTPWDWAPPIPDTPRTRQPPNQVPPRTRHPLGPGTPQDQAPHRTRHPTGPGTPQDQAPPPPPPPADGCCCGRYASYWNAFLFGNCFAETA